MVIFFNLLLVQLNILEEGLINHPVVGFGESGRKASELRILLAKIEESEVCVLLTYCLLLFAIISIRPCQTIAYLCIPSMIGC
jgi:hypothetical protein